MDFADNITRRPDLQSVRRRGWVKTSAECALDGVVVAAAVIIAAQGRPCSAARMALLAHCRRTGLLPIPPHRDVLADVDGHLRRFRADPTASRRTLIRTMNLLVGGPSAPLVLEAAQLVQSAVGDPAEATHAMLGAIEAALGVRHKLPV